jgi:DDE superfamily endonuclease
VFAFDEFGPLTIRPHLGAGWARRCHPDRLPANYHRPHRVRQFHGCYSVGDDTLWDTVRTRKSAGNTLAALKSIRAARPGGAPIYIILDNLSAHHGQTIRARAARNKVELCFTPTYSSWANSIEAHFGPLPCTTGLARDHRFGAAPHPAGTARWLLRLVMHRREPFACPRRLNMRRRADER